jgi:cytochrome P450
VYLGACIKEALRLRPPVAIMIRANELPEGGLDVLGYPIPPGAHMALFMYGVHRDPAYWERVEEFLPERFLPVSPPAVWPNSCMTHQLLFRVLCVASGWKRTAECDPPPAHPGHRIALLCSGHM